MVRNWYCRGLSARREGRALAAVPGVTNVAVADKTKTAVVTFDDTKADVQALIEATTEAGYPSFPRSGRDALAMKDRDAHRRRRCRGHVGRQSCSAALFLAAVLGSILVSRRGLPLALMP